VAVACLSPRLAVRTRAIAASYVVGWPLSRPGLQIFSIVPDEDEEAWKRAVLPIGTSGISWTALMLGLSALVRRSRLPAPVAAVLLGGVVAAGDSVLGDVFERLRTKAEAAAAAPDAEGTAST
jgi:hypothetical protein